LKKKTKKYLIGIAFIFILFFTIGGHFINKYYHKDVKNKPKMYVYHTFYGPKNPVLIIENLKYKENYVQFYKKVSQGKNPTFDFPLKTLPTNHPVYLIEFTSDSLLAKVVSYYDYGIMRGGDFTKGWVYAKCLHKEPPKK
jgi:hypothetical protein